MEEPFSPWRGKGALKGKVALVTGASRGVGKGTARGLGEAGATVYVTGRTVKEGQAAIPLPGTITQTAQEVTELGGTGYALSCDHRDDTQVEAVIRQIEREQGRLDILVNNVWGGYEQFHDGSEYDLNRPFWQRRLSHWDAMHQVGVRAHYIASALAIPLMLAGPPGLIVCISSFAGRNPNTDVPYGCAHAAIDRLAVNMAKALHEHHIAVVSLAPGLVRTEGVLVHQQYFDMSNSESPQFIGRAVAELALDPNVMTRTGQWLIAAELAQEYNFTDIDGRQPASLRS